jgi:hypothetical protein
MSVLDADGVVGAHAAFGSPSHVITRRRALYSATLELGADVALARDVPDEVLDDPVVRGHLGEVLAGVGSVSVDRLRRTPSVPLDGLPMGPRVVATHDAARILRPSLQRIAGELARHGEGPAIRLLTEDDNEFAEAVRLLTLGVRLAVTTAPRLAADLLPHVALFALVTRDAGGRLGSASAREYPGLIVLPAPTSAVEVAEALLHEGAHQKFFDLAVTHSIVERQASPTSTFSPPWAAPGSPPWRPEQCLAAFHAYTVLAAFALDVVEAGVELHPYSLLPHAHTRAIAIGEWLAARPQLLGPDGRRLVELLARRTIVDVDLPAPEFDVAAGTTPVVTRQCGQWSLILRAGSPVDAWWVPLDVR